MTKPHIPHIAIRFRTRALLDATLATGLRVALPALLIACTTSERPPVDSAASTVSSGATAAGTPPAAAPAPATGAAWQARPQGVQGTRGGAAVNLRIGSSASDTRSALGIAPAAPFAAGSCEYIAPGEQPVRLYFMALSDTLMRIDVRDSSVTTAEGARIGDTEARIKELYGNTVRVEPHKYTGPEGHYLIVTPAGDATHRIVFETDGQRVTTFRVGRLPAVEYVEGCS